MSNETEMSNLVGSNENRHTVPAGEKPTSLRRSILRWFGIMLVAISFLILFYGLIALIAYQRGDTARRDRIAADQAATVARQIELASADIDNGNFELAIRRIDYVLANEPSNTTAQALMDEANDGRIALLTPTITPTPTPTQTPTPSPTPTPAGESASAQREAAQSALEDALTLIEDFEWEAGIAQLEDIRRRYPDFRSRDVNEALYDAYVTYGLTLTRGTEIERGVFMLEKASELGDLSDEVLGEIFWAEQYLAGIVFYEIDWPAYLSYFRPMCEIAPLYQNSCGRLAEGLVPYAEQNMALQEYCPAEALFTEALLLNELDNDMTIQVNESVTIAREFCLNATPTPTVTPDFVLTPGIDDTLTVTLTDSITIGDELIIDPPPIPPTRTREP